MVPRLPALAALALCCLPAACARASRPPLILLVVVDTLRADHLGCYGYARDTTPSIDRLAARSTLFEAAYSQAPATMPAMWNLLSSRYQCPVPAPATVTTLAEILRERGYRTGAVVAQHFLSPGASGLDQGFEHYDFETDLDVHGNATRRAASVTDAALSWLDERPGEPTFLWLVYFDPHDPYVPPAPFRGLYTGFPADAEPYDRDRRAAGLHHESPPVPDAHQRFLIAAYDEEIRYLDEELGRLLEHLERSGRLEDALVVLTSDHGEQLGDHGGRWDHAQLLAREEIHVPLLIKLPGQGSARVTVEPVQTIDVVPTIVDLVGGPEPELGLEGRSLLAGLRGRTEGPGFAASFWRQQVSLAVGTRRLWITAGGEHVLSVPDDVPLEAGPEAEELRERARRLAEDLGLSREYYLETIRRLQELGYVK